MPHRRQILNRWTEYCSELYNCKANGDPSVLNCPQTDTDDDHPILRREMEAAVQSLKKGKSAGVDNTPAELVQAGGEDVITALTTICNKIWQTGEWPTPWTQSSVITLPKKSASSVIQAKSCWRSYWTDWSHTRRLSLKSRKEHPRADLQPMNPAWEISTAPARPLPCLHRLLEGHRQGLACSFVGNHEEVQHQHKPYPSLQKPV